MLRITRILAALIVLSVGTAAWAQGGGGLSVPRAAAAPTLGGRLDDWASGPQLTLAQAGDWRTASTEAAQYGGAEDISAEVRLAWDSQNLYVAVETRDDTLVRVNPATGIDHGDTVVLAFAAEDSKEVNQFAVALLKAASLVLRTDPPAQAGETKTIGRAIWAREDETGGWRVTYELAIPWAELATIHAIPGSKFTLTVSACDDDGAGLKGCLERSAKAELSNSTDASTPPPPELPTAAAAGLPASFLAPELVRWDKKRFVVGGHDALLFGAALDYTVLPQRVWADRLALLKAAGVNTVAVTVPWSYHQPAPDKLDLAELRAFLEAVGAAGLWAQVNVGPFAGERWTAGGLPSWYFGLDSEARRKAVDDWLTGVLGVVKDYQQSGPVISVVIRPRPEPGGRADAASLIHLTNTVRGAGIVVPTLAANAPAARENEQQTLANLLDSISFYEPPTLSEVALGVQGLTADENGPAVVSGLPGSYLDPTLARQSADAVRVALAKGATAVTIADFARGVDAQEARRPEAPRVETVIGPSGLPGPGYGEMKLIGSFVKLYGPLLSRAVPAEGLLRADDRDVQTAVRLSDKSGFIFLWSEKGTGPRQVRLSYSEPGTTAITSIPAAGSIALPAEGAKVFPIDVPLGRGTLRYTTSEIAAQHAVGDRTLLVVYGDQDTPGELVLRWPGRPLVVGEVLHQDWNDEAKTLTLDYYHKQQDQYVLADDLQICILSRERAMALGEVGEQRPVTLSAGGRIVEGTLAADTLKATISVPAGVSQVTAALPAQPSVVLVDGKATPFAYTSPQRVLSFNVNTQTFEQEQKPASVWERIGRGVAGGPPKLRATFSRAPFRADEDAPKTNWMPLGPLGQTPESLGLKVGDFARFRTRLDLGGKTTLALSGAVDPTLVLVNGKPVVFASDSPDREADIMPLLLPGSNEISLLIQIAPREMGEEGTRGPAQRLPLVSLKGVAGESVLDRWEMSLGLAGEAAGYAAPKLASAPWDVLHFGAWREQGKRYQDVTGPAWYRVTFSLPKTEAWEIPFDLKVAVSGNAEVYLNGTRIASLAGGGTHRLPLVAPPLVANGENVLAIAVYDPAGKPGLNQVEIEASPDDLLRRHQVEVKF